MPFVEVFSPKGAVSEDQRNRISERLVREVMEAEGAPDNEIARSISWLAWHEPVIWSIGGRDVGDGEPGRYVVRVTVPAGSLTDEKRAEIVRRVTQVLSDADHDPGRLFALPISSFVLLNEVPEGNWGAVGQVVGFSDIASFILTGTPGQMDEDAVRKAFALEGEAAEEPAPAHR